MLDGLFNRKEIIAFFRRMDLRIAILIAAVAVMAAGLVYRLFTLQIVNGERYLTDFHLQIKRDVSLPATRGMIYDRNGNVLAYNELTYSVTIRDLAESSSHHDEDLNRTILETVALIEKYGDQLVDGFGIALDEAAGEYVYTVSGRSLQRFLADVYGKVYIDDMDEEQKNSTAQDIMNLLAVRYGLAKWAVPDNRSAGIILTSDYDKVTLRKLIMIRYRLSLNSYQKYIATTIATNIKDTTLAAVMENRNRLEGVEITEDTLRRYNDSVYFAQIIYYASSLLPVAMLIIAAQVLVITLILRQLLKREVEAVEARTSASGTVTTLLSGIQKIKLAGAEDRAFSKWAEKFSVYAKASFNRPRYLYCLDAFVGFIGMLGILGIYLKAMSTGYSTANFMAFNTAFGQINASIIMFTGMIASMVRSFPKFDHLSPILKAAPECDDEKPSIKDVDGSIEVNGLSFRYSEETPWVIDNISFSIKKGEYVAIVGRSGCGKSTLMRLLLGFEQPDAGNIMYGEYDLSRINLRSLRQKGISMVMQDAKLLKGDIFENITLSNPDATLEDAWEAAEIAGIANDIREMPMQMSTLVSEGGGGVSGGQRQRLIIARAVCSRRKIMILDEATSALDNITQQAVAESLDKLDCTRIAIAHRLSTVKHCDRILVLDKGRICEEGTYEELIKKNGVFAELVKKQRLDI